MSRPYRSTLLPFISEQSICQINKEEGLLGDRAYEKTLEAIERIERSKGADQDRLRSWIYHPDERVPIALLHKESVFRLVQNPGGNGPLVMEAIYNRATQQAASEQVLWNPLLDALASVRRWNMEGAMFGHLFHTHRLASGPARSMKPYLGPHSIDQALSAPSLSEALDPLAQWIRGQGTAADVIPLLEFGTTEIHRLVASHARGLSDRDLHAILKKTETKIVVDLAENRSLTNGQRGLVGRHILASVVRLGRGDLRTTAGKRAMNHAREAPEVLKALIDQNTCFDSRQMRRAGRAAATTPVYDVVNGHYQSYAYGVQALLALGDLLPTDILQDAILNFEGSGTMISALLSHPAITEEILLNTLRKHSKFSVRLTIAHATARLDSPQIREELAKSQSPAIAGALVGGEKNPRRHNSLLKKALKRPDGQAEVIRSLEDFGHYVCLDHIIPEMLRTLYHVSIPREIDGMEYNQLSTLFAEIGRSIKVISLFRKISRHYLAAATKPPLAREGQFIFDKYFSKYAKTYIELGVMAGAYSSPARQVDPENLRHKALANILGMDPGLADNFSIDMIKSMIKSTDKDIRLIAIRAIPLAKKGGTPAGEVVKKGRRRGHR